MKKMQNQNKGNVGQASGLFDEERGPEFDTTLGIIVLCVVVICEIVL